MMFTLRWRTTRSIMNTYIGLVGRNRCAVQRRFCGEGLDHHQVLGIMYLQAQTKTRLKIRKIREQLLKRILTRADLSLLLVTQYVRSLLNCKSVITSLCARSLFSISSPDFTLKSATFPDSWPVMMTLGVGVKAQTVAFEPMGLNMNRGSLDSEEPWSVRETCNLDRVITHV